MKKILIPILSLFIFTASHADIVANISEKISEYVTEIMPGDGYTEVDIDLTDANDNDPTINMLMLRNLDKKETTNLFTQFSIQTHDVGQNSSRYIGNLGLGYRFLNDDKSLMLGGNVFYDRDLSNNHQRGSLGFEARGGNLEINANFYEPISLQSTTDGRKEQALAGYDFNLSSQIPYVPWARVNYTSYEWEKDIGTADTKGTKYSSEMNINSSLVFEIEYDESGNTGGDDVTSAGLTFVYPPRDEKITIENGLTSSEAFTFEDVSSKLDDKVKRNNKIVIETQGAVVITKK